MVGWLVATELVGTRLLDGDCSLGVDGHDAVADLGLHVPKQRCVRVSGHPTHNSHAVHTC